MAEPRRDVLTPSGALSEAFSALFAAAIVFGVAYLLAGVVTDTAGYKDASIVRIVRYVVAALFALLTLFSNLNEVREALDRRKARDANRRVTESFDKIHAEGRNKDVAQISTKQVAAEVSGAQVSPEQLERLAQQVKQKALIDDRYLQEDVRDLIVEYLQPLPRNAKRVLNRLRVSRLIADKRGLFTTEPKVDVEQIAKWLVLGERWPQLGRSLAVAPAKMEELEADASSPSSFRNNVRVLAPFYVDDQDLRIFIGSEPRLSRVLERLVEYGAGSLPEAQAEGGGSQP